MQPCVSLEATCHHDTCDAPGLTSLHFVFCSCYIWNIHVTMVSWVRSSFIWVKTWSCTLDPITNSWHRSYILKGKLFSELQGSFYTAKTKFPVWFKATLFYVIMFLFVFDAVGKSFSENQTNPFVQTLSNSPDVRTEGYQMTKGNLFMPK